MPVPLGGGFENSVFQPSPLVIVFMLSAGGCAARPLLSSWLLLLRAPGILDEPICSIGQPSRPHVVESPKSDGQTFLEFGLHYGVDDCHVVKSN